MNDRMNAEWIALRDAVNALLQRAAAAQGLLNQHEFLPADTDVADITQALHDCDYLVRRAVIQCALWREVQS